MSIEFLGIAVLVLAAIAAGALISRHLRSTRRRSTGEVFDELFFDELFGDLVAQQKSTLSGGIFRCAAERLVPGLRTRGRLTRRRFHPVHLGACREANE